VHPAFPAPSLWRDTETQASGVSRRENADVYLLFDSRENADVYLLFEIRIVDRRPGQASIASADLRCAIAHRGTHTP
jgi:hypothetical protein